MNNRWKVKQGKFDKFYWEVEAPNGMIFLIRGAYTREEAIAIVKEKIKEEYGD